jgi:hypothetical protein
LPTIINTVYHAIFKIMKSPSLIIWVSIVGVIGIVFGIFYAFFGLNGLPVYQMFVPNTVYTQWSNGLYGSVFIGFSVLLFFVGRHAFQTKNKTLMRALLYGIASWLIVEAAFSFYYGIYINVGVDLALIVFLGFPLLIGIRSKNK